jgi:hypothetical protein
LIFAEKRFVIMLDWVVLHLLRVMVGLIDETSTAKAQEYL